MLHLAVKSNSNPIFQVILKAFKENNLNVNLPDVHGWTALQYSLFSSLLTLVMRLLMTLEIVPMKKY